MNNTLSIVPSDGTSGEFPVLKAFQEYIDAEQAKARKRMLGLSVFFVILLIVVVVTFVLILTTVVNRNQALSDRLLDYALKERERVPVPVVQQPAPPVAPQVKQPSAEEILKPYIDRMEKERIEMKESYEKQQKKYEKEIAVREAARDEELRKVKDELEKERIRTKKENDRQAEIERHRRRLYPDYYKMPSQDANSGNIPPPPSAEYVPPRPQPKQQVPAEKPKVKPAEKPLSSIQPVTYFNLDDDDDVSFILERPKQPQQTQQK